MSRSEHPPSTRRRRVAVVLVLATALTVSTGPNVAARPLDRGPGETPVIEMVGMVEFDPSRAPEGASDVWSATWPATPLPTDGEGADEDDGADPAMAAEIDRLLGAARAAEAARVRRWVEAVAAHEARLEAERREAERVAAERAAAERAAAERDAAKRAAARRTAERDKAASAPHGGSGGPNLAALRACESGGNYGAVNPTGTYRGAYQFSRSTWNSVAAKAYPHLVGVDPAAASPADQDAMAAALYASQGSRPWPHCGKRL